MLLLSLFLPLKKLQLTLEKRSFELQGPTYAPVIATRQLQCFDRCSGVCVCVGGRGLMHHGAAPFYMGDLSVVEFGRCVGSWNPPPYRY